MLFHAGTQLHCSRVGSGTHWTDRALVSSLVGQGSVANGKALAQDAQIGGGCPIPGNIQDQSEKNSEKPDKVEGVPIHCRSLDQVAFKSSFPTQTLVWFWSYMAPLPASSSKYRSEETEQHLCILCRAGAWFVLCLQNLPADWAGLHGDGPPWGQNCESPGFPLGRAHGHIHTETRACRPSAR